METIGVTEAEFPVLRIYNADKKTKYKYEGDVASLTLADIDKFIEDYKANKLEAYLKSEPIPENKGNLKVLVGKNF